MKFKRSVIKVFGATAALVFVAGASIVLSSDGSYAKTKLAEKKASIGINQTVKISVKSLPKGAKLSFKSSKKSVAKVNSKGKVTGVKVGNAKIVVKYKKGKKTKSVGTFKVSVLNAKLKDYVVNPEEPHWIPCQTGLVRSQKWWLLGDEPEYIFNYYNPKATYTFSSSDTSKVIVDKTGYVKDTLAPGEVYIIVKEKYKNKTRTVGKVRYVVTEPSLYEPDNNELDVLVDKRDLNIGSMIYAVGRYNCVVDVEDVESDPNNTEDDEDDEDDGPIEFERSEGEWNENIIFHKTGTWYVRLYAYNYDTELYDTKSFARLVVHAKEGKKTLDDVGFGFYDDDDNYFKNKPCTMDRSSTQMIYITSNEKEFTGKVTVTSSDESVLTVTNPYLYDRPDEGDDDSFLGYFYVSACKRGVSTVTIDAGGVKKSIDITVGFDYNITLDDGRYTIGYFNVPKGTEIDLSKFSVKFSEDLGLSGEVDDDYDYNEYVSSIWYSVYVASSEDSKYGTTDMIVSYDGKEIARYKIVVEE